MGKCESKIRREKRDKGTIEVLQDREEEQQKRRNSEVADKKEGNH
jgi:hypothetical protein